MFLFKIETCTFVLIIVSFLRCKLWEQKQYRLLISKSVSNPPAQSQWFWVQTLMSTAYL